MTCLSQKQRQAKSQQSTRNQTQGPWFEQLELGIRGSIPGDCLGLMSSSCQLFTFFYLTSYLASFPAFHRLQYGKTGRACYLLSCEPDIIGKWQKISESGWGLGTRLPHTIKHAFCGKFSGIRWCAEVATNITCRSVYDQLELKTIIVKICS